MAETVQFKAGDVVRLKSGGPAMTVTAVDDYLGTPSAWVEWFDDKKQSKNGTYALQALTIYEPPNDQPAWSNPKPRKL